MKIGVLTSGGDSPGMNAAVRTVAVVGRERGHEVVGVRGGYAGLLEGDLVVLEPSMVSNISGLGGTILGSARSSLFPKPEGQVKARQRLAEAGLEALVVIGGNGSLTGAHALAAERSCLILGLPASIDNDIGHTGLAIGVDTAVNTIVDACDRISDTARAHRRAFVVEVMGRNCGFLALRAGIAAEADAILFGEAKRSEDEVVSQLREVLRKAFTKGWYKQRVLIVKSESVPVPTRRLVERLQEHLESVAPGVEIRETVLGHMVRGGRPSAMDRVIGQRLAYAAILGLEAGAHDVMAAWDAPLPAGQATMDPHVRLVPLGEVLEETGRLLDGTSPVVRKWIELITSVENLLVV